MGDIVAHGDGLVTSERRDGINIITLNRPESRNTINHALRVAMVEAFSAANADRDSRAVVVTGAEGHFSGGGDLKGMTDRDIRSVHERMNMAAQVTRLIRRSPKPYIAAIEGSAFGAGLSIPLACDQIVASQSAKFCSVFVRAGLVPDYGMMHTLPRRVGDGIARRMMMTACVVSAEEALQAGLIDQLVPVTEALETALQTAAEFSAHAPLAVHLIKAAMADGRSDRLDSCLDAEADLQGQLFQTDDFTEALNAFGEKRTPLFRGT
ncbi:enoyl-CoA hydratase/isomerase family protein [Sphingobium sp. V4]|uniref:enoyl-CoA hydratase/isomerase family protein n=1 Tax=Sphingobium sp. V4 TaxID=3038927 RepID=UPI0025581982|nr:enoyl-CoA hydratase/isomerase family protein [Sphingobium sp. V4]WIW89544.1 enoyl-CoA hydratase/isomerase family protein [Sphingobium sp. V4]